jgi:hypothetical protein
MNDRRLAGVRKFVGVWSACTGALVWVLAGQSQAVERIWGGGSASPIVIPNWNISSNWTGDTVPVNTDMAIFTNTSVLNCTIDAGVDVQGFRMATGYSGQVTNGANTVTIGSGGMTISAGTFKGGPGTLTVNGDFTLGGSAACSFTGLKVDINGNCSVGRNINMTTVSLQGVCQESDMTF